MPILPRNRSLSYRKRPLFVIQVYSEDSDDQENHLVDSWRWDSFAPLDHAGCVNALIKRLDQAYDIGYRDFCLHMPVGKTTDSAEGFYGVNPWTGMPVNRQQEMTALYEWIQAKKLLNPSGLTFGIYISIPARKDFDGTLIGLVSGEITIPDPSTLIGQNWLKNQVNSWSETGAERLWLDSAANTDSQSEMQSLSFYEAFNIQKPYYESLNFHVGGGDIPVSSDFLSIDESVVNDAWLGSNSYIDTLESLVNDTFSFNYNAATRVCTINTFAPGKSYEAPWGGIYSLTGNLFTRGGTVSPWVSGDVVYIKTNNGFTYGKYVIESITGNDTITLSSTQPYAAGSLPVTNCTNVVAQYTLRPGIATTNWTPINETDEITIAFHSVNGFSNQKMIDLMDNGLRIGFWGSLDYDSIDNDEAERIYNNYLDWITSKSTTTRVIRKQN